MIEIPQPAPVVTVHQAQTRLCAGCGACTTAPFPVPWRAEAMHDLLA